ncbi:MAG TPA: phospholipase A [Steroidobacteraceae bacterium]|nr:phospholipase A [Steroidobacteraceae bacterium]
MLRRIIGSLAVLLLARVVSADALLSTSTTKVAQGAPLQLELTLLNPTNEPEVVEVPDELHLRLETQNRLATVVARSSQSGEITVEPHGFVRLQVQASLPKAMVGQVTVAATGFDTNPVALQIAGDEKDATALTEVPPPKSTWNAQYTLVDKPPPIPISVYEPIYFLVGGDGGLNAKFQLSLRYRLFDDKGRLANHLPWIDDLYLSFTQTSLWNLHDQSNPFQDSSYRPRLFYADYSVAKFFDGRLRLGLEGGVGHESNGKDGEESRSYNMLYVRPVALLGDPEGLRAFIAPLIHNYIAESDNPDIQKYRGYVDWLVGIGSKGGLDFSATLRKGTASNFGSVELNLSYPLSKLSGGDLTGWLLLQYFAGYGESLLDYNRKLDSQWRLGVAVAL